MTDGPTRESRRCSLRTVAAGVGLLVVGALIGGWLRPRIGEWNRARQLAGGAVPMPEFTGAYQAQVHEYERLDRMTPTGSIVYLGDSITDLMNVNELLTCENASIVNRGISGDTTAAVLKRVSQSFPPSVRVCFLLIGVNDLRYGAAPVETAQRILQLASLLRDRHRVEYVIIESLLPGPADLADSIEKVNLHLAEKLRAAGQISFFDLGRYFVVQGRQASDLFDGDVHLNGDGMVKRLSAELDLLSTLVPDLQIHLISTAEGR